MNNFFKKSLIAFTAIASLLTVPAFAQETVKVGMSGRYFPFTFQKNDVLQGFEVDLWTEIAKRSDYKVEFVTSTFSILTLFLKFLILLILEKLLVKITTSCFWNSCSAK